MLNELNNKRWNWWPLFPLYPYGSKKTICRELFPNKIWSLEQIQGLYYVAVPIRMTVIKVNGGLMLINPLPPTKELISELERLSLMHGEVKCIVLPTSSGLEHKIGLPSLARIFDNADIWISPGQWSFPVDLPLKLIGIPPKRTKVLFKDGLPFEDIFIWSSLGPINLGLGRYQEITLFHKETGTLHVTDVIVGIDSSPPEIFEYDPTPLLFHSRDRGDEPLIDSPDSRRKGWARLVLFASYLRPSKLKIPNLKYIFKYSFKDGLRNKKAHFGIYPFLWEEDWESSLLPLMDDSPKIQIAPVLKKLIFPRSKDILIDWLNKLIKLEDLKYLISAHYSSPVSLKKEDCMMLLMQINSEDWVKEKDDEKFLSDIYKRLFKLGIIPKDKTIKNF